MKITLKAGVVSLLLSASAHAELPNLFNKARDLVTGAVSKQSAPAEQQNFGADIVGTPPSQPTQASPNGPGYFTKQQFFEDVRRGEMADYGKIANYGVYPSKQLVYAIGVILEKEYGTPIPNWDGKNRFAGGSSQATCDNTLLKQDIHTLIQAVTKNRMSLLSKQPPAFVGVASPEDAQFINDMFRRIASECRLAANQTAPFIKTLGQLMTEYAKVTDEYVAQQRILYGHQYQQATAQKKLEDQQRADTIQRQEAARKAAEQSQIDADRRRIEEKERKAKEQDKNRVAG